MRIWMLSTWFRATDELKAPSPVFQAHGIMYQERGILRACFEMTRSSCLLIASHDEQVTWQPRELLLAVVVPDSR